MPTLHCLIYILDFGNETRYPTGNRWLCHRMYRSTCKHQLYRSHSGMLLAGIQRFKRPDNRSSVLGRYVVVVLTSGVL